MLLIPTNMAVSHVLLGTAQNPLALDLNHLDVRVRLDGATIGFRDGVTATDDIWARVLWVINEFVIARGYQVTADHIIIPGALTGIHPGKPGRYTVDYGALGAVEFTILP